MPNPEDNGTPLRPLTLPPEFFAPLTEALHQALATVTEPWERAIRQAVGATAKLLAESIRPHFERPTWLASVAQTIAGQLADYLASDQFGSDVITVIAPEAGGASEDEQVAAAWRLLWAQFNSFQVFYPALWEKLWWRFKRRRGRVLEWLSYDRSALSRAGIHLDSVTRWELQWFAHGAGAMWLAFRGDYTTDPQGIAKRDTHTDWQADIYSTRRQLENVRQRDSDRGRLLTVILERELQDLIAGAPPEPPLGSLSLARVRPRLKRELRHFIETDLLDGKTSNSIDTRGESPTRAAWTPRDSDRLDPTRRYVYAPYASDADNRAYREANSIAEWGTQAPPPRAWRR